MDDTELHSPAGLCSNVIDIVFLLDLSGFTVHAGQQQPGSLPHIVTVHREAPSMFSVSNRHPDPLHQRGQHQERPAEKTGSCATV